MRKNLFILYREKFKTNSELDIFLKGQINSQFFGNSNYSFSFEDFTKFRKDVQKQPLLVFNDPKIKQFILTFLLNSFIQEKTNKNDFHKSIILEGVNLKGNNLLFCKLIY